MKLPIPDPIALIERLGRRISLAVAAHIAPGVALYTNTGTDEVQMTAFIVAGIVSVAAIVSVGYTDRFGKGTVPSNGPGEY